MTKTVVNPSQSSINPPRKAFYSPLRKWVPLVLWKMPQRIWALVWHIFLPIIIPIRWMMGGFKGAIPWKQAGLRLGKWLVRILTRILDLVGVGEWMDLFTRIFQPKCRILSDWEMGEAQKVFGQHFPLERVRIIEESVWAKRWAGQYPGQHLGFVVSRIIRFSRKLNTESSASDMGWLIHELVHVAQMEAVGLQYIPEALYAQRTGGYDYGGSQALPGKQLGNFNREQQAMIAQDYYMRQCAGADIPPAYSPYLEAIRKGEFVRE